MQELPADPAALTPEWLSEALGTRVGGVEILQHAFATNQRARIGLRCADAGAAPATLFVKLAPLDPVHRQMIGATGMGEREAQFYADAAGAIDLLVPRCWYAASRGDRFVLLLEDLSLRGCRFSGGEWGISADVAARALEDLARFHARFESRAERDRIAPWLRAPSPRMSEATAGLMRMVLDANAGRLSLGYTAIGELYVKHTHGSMSYGTPVRRPTPTATPTSATSFSTATGLASSTGVSHA